MIRRLIVLSLSIALLAAACGGGDDDDTTATTAPGTTVDTGDATTTTRAPAPSTTTTVAQTFTAPLTGVAVTESEAAVLATRPALAVKTDNAPAARPQYGLDVADVIYEEPVEGITRYIAIYHSTDPGIVGPIRSVRGIDANTLAPLDALFAISGGVAGFVQAASETTQLFQEGTEGYYRDDSRRRPHNLLAVAAELWAQADSPIAPQPLFQYLDEGTDFVGTPVSGFTIHNLGTRSDWVWDPTTRTWPRTLDGTPHLTVSGVQVAPRNVIIQYVDLRGGVEMGEGDAVVLVDGQMVEGRWSKEEAEDVTRFTTASGEDIELLPGQTWVNLVPVGSDVEIQQPGT